MGHRSRIRGRSYDARDTLFSEGESYGAIFHCVYLSSAYRLASSKSKVLLFDLIYQYRGNNNGRLVLCPKEKDKNDGLTLLERTGLSETSVYRAAAELEALGLIVCTRRGNFARKPSFYGLTWSPIDDTAVTLDMPVSLSTPLHWWKNGPPDWQIQKLARVSKTHGQAIEFLNGPLTDNCNAETVASLTTGQGC